MGVVGTEYADWNEARTKIKLGQEGGGFRRVLLSPDRLHLFYRNQGLRPLPRYCEPLRPLQLGVQMRGRPQSGWGDKDQGHQAAWEAQRRGLEPGLVGRMPIRDIKDSFRWCC